MKKNLNTLPVVMAISLVFILICTSGCASFRDSLYRYSQNDMDAVTDACQFNLNREITHVNIENVDCNQRLSKLKKELNATDSELIATEERLDISQETCKGLVSDLKEGIGYLNKCKESLSLCNEKNNTPKKKTMLYVIKQHDWLSKIAGFDYIYGDINRWPEIYEVNKHIINDPNRIFPGQEIVIEKD